MKKFVIIILIFLLSATQLKAQEQDTLLLKRHAVTTSPLPILFGGAFLATYEHALPWRSSLELELGAQGFYWKKNRGGVFGAPTRPGIVATSGYKFYLPLGKVNKKIALAGGIPYNSFFLKTRLTYVHQWSSYDVYVGNNGWDIITQHYTFHENDLFLAFILGYQFVSKQGFVIAPFMGYNLPLYISGPIHPADFPGSSAAHIGFATMGLKMGWAF